MPRTTRSNTNLTGKNEHDFFKEAENILKNSKKESKRKSQKNAKKSDESSQIEASANTPVDQEPSTLNTQAETNKNNKLLNVVKNLPFTSGLIGFTILPTIIHIVNGTPNLDSLITDALKVCISGGLSLDTTLAITKWAVSKARESGIFSSMHGSLTNLDSIIREKFSNMQNSSKTSACSGKKRKREENSTDGDLARPSKVRKFDDCRSSGLFSLWGSNNEPSSDSESDILEQISKFQEKHQNKM